MDNSDNRDWVGGKKSVYTTLGASSHSKDERENRDYYATDPVAMELLLAEETFARKVWEPACGEGHLAKVLEAHGYAVLSSDIVYRGYGNPEPYNFLSPGPNGFDGDIITNPPYRHALEFVEKALDIVEDGNKVAMFLKLQFLEGKGRKRFFKKYPPKIIYVSSSRIKCAKNGDFDSMQSSAVAYGWFIWEKGYTGEPVIRWIN